MRKEVKKMNKDVNLSDNVKVVTSNLFITACGLEKLSLKARKLFYLAIAQCELSDKDFFEYSIKASEFAKIMDVKSTNVYQEADNITTELMKTFLIIRNNDESMPNVPFKKCSLFSFCTYTSDAKIYFKLSPDMTAFFLDLKKDFSKPLLSDFMRMNSPYTMAIWHLMQKEMHSRKPKITETIEFDLSLEDMRLITGTTDKLKQLVHFKERILNKALNEIENICDIKITYADIKQSRTVTGFHFTAVSKYHINENNISEKTKQKLKAFEEKKRKMAAS